MDVDAAHRFTRNRIVLGDMLLNTFLGLSLIVAPSTVDSIQGRLQLLPLEVYRGLGVAFLVFALWQTYHLIGQQLGRGALVVAAWAAEIPVVGLTVALVFMDLPLKPGARGVLWIGDIYMLILGGWYGYLAYRLSHGVEDTTHDPQTHIDRR